MPAPSRRPPLAQPPRDFRLNLFALRWVRFMPYLLLAPLAVLVALGFRDDSPLRQAAPILLAVMFLLLPLTLWLRRLFAQMLAGQQEAASRFTTVSPKACRLENTRYADTGGQIFLVRDVDSPADSPRFAARMRFSRRVWNLPEQEPVDVFMDPVGVSPVFAVAASTVSGWGEVLTRQDLETGWRQTRRLVTWLIALVLLGCAVAGWLLFQQYDLLRQTRQRAAESLTWPSVQGVILESEVAETRIPSGKTSVQGWEALVQYEYVVDGVTYPGERIHYGYAPTRTRQDADTLAATYPAGQPAAVHYDPALPARSVLEPGHVETLDAELAQIRLVMAAATGGLLLMSCIPAGVLWYTGRRRRQLELRLETLGLLPRP
ncbi:DUF3592 domain-containing protein [Megalodesulfovibrio gigas]|uniref:DUF3592 domain-containing protein n=1 Tax=Megalodesulfovibrio gigas TaxID=879 RepID=UPI00130E3BCF|nr:DUF3592 domain-containing protein [Megalodesulfovibrio gigas]